MALHFTSAELAERRQRTCRELAARGLDGLLMFRQESMYYLTGYDTFGYVFFQCLYLHGDGRMTLLARSPDLRQARHTSVIRDIRIWVDSPEANPAVELRGILADYGCRHGRLGVEYNAYGLTAADGRRLDAALEGFCTLEDASDLVSRLRAIKSPAELSYVRKAAALGDQALAAAYDRIGPGVFEGDILATLQGSIFQGGGDYSGNEFVIASGGDALLCRSFTGRRYLSNPDQLTIEFAGAYRHYHAALMRTVPIGRAGPRHRHMHAVCVEAMQACLEALRPGQPVGEVFDAYARVCDGAGMGAHRLNATGYGMGTTFAPNWMDWPMLYHGNPAPALPNMVFFIHIILMDSDSRQAMTLGQSALVTDSGSQPLSRMPLDLIVK